MRCDRTRHVAAIVTLLIAWPAAVAPVSAQSSYLTAAFGADFSHFNQSSVDGTKSDPPEGLSPVAAVRLGTAFGDRWGVETELAFAGTIENERQGDLDAVARTLIAVPVGFYVLSSLTAGLPGRPEPVYHVRIRRANSTFSAVGWVAKGLKQNLDLVVLFGVALNRVTAEANLSVTPSGSASIRPKSARAITYAFGPLVGTELRVRAGEHWRVVPSVRLHKLDAQAARGCYGRRLDCRERSKEGCRQSGLSGWPTPGPAKA